MRRGLDELRWFGRGLFSGDEKHVLAMNRVVNVDETIIEHL